MSARKRPVAVLVIACLFMAVGALGFVHHLLRPSTIHENALRSEFTELLAVAAGAFLLRGKSWARWLALAWMAIHVATCWPEVRQVATHALVLAAAAWLLFEPEAQRYFAKDRRSIHGAA